MVGYRAGIRVYTFVRVTLLVLSSAYLECPYKRKQLIFFSARFFFSFKTHLLMAEPDFDERWYSAQPGQFPPFRVGDADSKSVSATGFAKNTELLVFKVKGLPFAIRTMDLAYHHVVQGSIKKEPFMVSFCGVCHR